jgi:hypothetical protein
MVIRRRYPLEQVHWMTRMAVDESVTSSGRPYIAMLNATQVLAPKTTTQHPPKAESCPWPIAQRVWLLGARSRNSCRPACSWGPAYRPCTASCPRS